MQYQEIERKFLLTDASGHQRFYERINAIASFKQASAFTTSTHDLYLLVPAGLPFVYRYRYDDHLQQLSAKSLADTLPVRKEINLNLAPSLCHKDAVLAFFTTLGLAWQGEINKHLTVYRFNDCEIVHYTAHCGERSLECIEIEALDARDIHHGLQIIERYQRDLDIEAYAHETPASLFHLLIQPILPAEIISLLKRTSVANHP